MKYTETQKNLLEVFHRLYKGCKLFCIHLDGFTHSVFYKDNEGKRHIDVMSAYAPEQYEDDHECFNTLGDKVIRSMNKDKTKVLFMGYPHYSFQNNAKEYIYQDVTRW